ncbi:MAG: nuclear transport factor 2 family protein [Alphaproteobacteria bacterium]|nr:nuclear transport factor 2 family protein [Alphaproteobacteria bacterium]
MDRALLTRLTLDFTDAFNRDDLDGVMSYFAEDGIYDEFNGIRNVGKAANRQAFEPQFRGEFGQIRFHQEDLFVDAESGKSMISWTLTMAGDGRKGGWRGLDLLHFRDGKLVQKHTYAKTQKPLVQKLA